jgi:hypothetical protein
MSKQVSLSRQKFPGESFASTLGSMLMMVASTGVVSLLEGIIVELAFSSLSVARALRVKT